MRLLLVLALLAGVFSAAPAAAAEAPDAPAPGESAAPETARGPIQEPEDWLVVAGIVCYVVLPIVLIVTAGVLAYQWWVRETDAALMPGLRSADWIARGLEARPPPGVVLLRF